MTLSLFPAAEGSIDSIVTGQARNFGEAHLLPVAVPAALSGELCAGRYLLARCGAQSPTERLNQWQIYLRRALFVSQTPSPAAGDAPGECWLAIPPGEDAGHVWLRQLPAHAALHLLGPLGNGFPRPERALNVLLLGEAWRCAQLSPLLDPVLDQGGKVVMVVLGAPPGAEFAASLPLAVELRHAPDEASWHAHLAETLRWADRICASLPWPRLPSLAAAIRQHRTRFESNFAYVLVEADLACGVGACLACVVPLARGGLTRACIHGPVMDLAALYSART
jgi:dihydroorotate dehydrogenase electron transfer subunit